MKLTSEDYAEWRDHPVTCRIVRDIEEKLEEKSSNLPFDVIGNSSEAYKTATEILIWRDMLHHIKNIRGD